MRNLISALTLSFTIPAAFAQTTLDTSQQTDLKPSAKIERIGDTLAHPWGMDFLSDTEILVTERGGKLFHIDIQSQTQREVTGVPDVFSFRQGGLLDIKVDENDPSTIYFCYSKPDGNQASTALGKAVLKDFELTDQSTLFVANNISNSSIHFGCRIEIVNDQIYLAVGERGQRDEAQDPSIHSGAVIRLNLDGSIPQDNPSSGGLSNSVDYSKWQDDIFSKGHRNPQGMALNPHNGEIWLHEHGPRGGDEINIVQSGLNYGWPKVSYGEEYSGGKIGLGTSAKGYEEPIWKWVPSIAPSGMAFYQGSMFPDLDGHLLIGSLKFRSLYLVALNKNRPVSESVLFQNVIGRIRDVDVAADGSIYLLNDEKDGGVYRIFQ